jgi:putative sterol carrier protein
MRRRVLRRLRRWVGRASDERLERLMAGRLGRRILRAIFRGAERRFNPQRARDRRAVVEFWIGGRRDGRRDHWQLVIAEGRCEATTSVEREPDLTIEIDGGPFLRLVAGAATGPELLLTERLKLDGDLLLAQRLPRLFRR